MLPAIITLEVDDDALRFVIAGVVAIVLIGAVVWSSRKTEGMLARATRRIARHRHAVAGWSAG